MNTNTVRVLKSLLVCSIFLASCTSKKSKIESLEDGVKKADKAAPAFVIQDGEFLIEGDEAQRLYDSMIAVEKKNGIKIVKGKLHSTRGTVSCTKSGSVKSCFFRTRVERADYLDARRKMTKKITNRIWRYFAEVRPDIEDEPMVVSELICDFIGKKTPPFNVEKLTCHLRNPHLPNEAIVGDREAEEIAAILRGHIPFTDSILSVRGSILCQWIKGSGRSPCVLRPIVGGTLQEKFLEVPGQVANVVGSLLIETIKDDLIYQNGGKSKPIKLPSEIVGSVVCVVDSSTFLSHGRRKVVCRIAI